MPHFQATGVGTNGAATATQAAVTDSQHVVTSIHGHSDADTLVTIESPAGTVLWQSGTDISAEGYQFGASGLRIYGVKGQAIVGKSSASTTDSQVTIEGDIIIGTFARGEQSPAARGM